MTCKILEIFQILVHLTGQGCPSSMGYPLATMENFMEKFTHHEPRAHGWVSIIGHTTTTMKLGLHGWVMSTAHDGCAPGAQCMGNDPWLGLPKFRAPNQRLCLQFYHHHGLPPMDGWPTITHRRWVPMNGGHCMPMVGLALGKLKLMGRPTNTMPIRGHGWAMHCLAGTHPKVGKVHDKLKLVHLSPRITDSGTMHRPSPSAWAHHAWAWRAHACDAWAQLMGDHLLSKGHPKCKHSMLRMGWVGRCSCMPGALRAKLCFWHGTAT